MALPQGGSGECRVPVAPAAARVEVVSTRVSHHGHTGNARRSPRNGFNGFLRALPGDRAFLSPSPLRSLLLKSLTPASRRQDHTTSPSAICAVRHLRIRVHRIPPRVRDDREPPLRWDETVENKPVIWVWCEEGIFLRRGLDRQIRKLPVGGKSVGVARMSAATCGVTVDAGGGNVGRVTTNR